MSFTKTGPNSASDGLVEIKIAKRDQLHMVESGNITVVPIEIGGDRVVAIYISKVAAETRSAARGRISEALDVLGIPHRFDA
jgi:hypothetical protein